MEPLLLPHLSYFDRFRDSARTWRTALRMPSSLSVRLQKQYDPIAGLCNKSPYAAKPFQERSDHCTIELKILAGEMRTVSSVARSCFDKIFKVWAATVRRFHRLRGLVRARFVTGSACVTESSSWHVWVLLCCIAFC